MLQMLKLKIFLFDQTRSVESFLLVTSNILFVISGQLNEIGNRKLKIWQFSHNLRDKTLLSFHESLQDLRT